MGLQRGTVQSMREHIKRLELVGTRMSNLLYNHKQNEALSKHTRDSMGELVRRWDAAVRREP